MYLHEHGPLRQTQLATRMGIGRAAMGTSIDGLERRQIVERRPDPDDRRAWRVSLTVAGKDLVGPIHDIDREVRAVLRLDISRAERQQLAKLLLRLQGNLARMLEEPAAD